MTPALLVRMGRVSNLPTVVTNALAGLVLAGAVPDGRVLIATAIAAALLYVAGMVLNDVYDADIDARERPERPIPAGEVSRREATAYGYALLLAGVALAGASGMILAPTPNPWPGIAAAITAALVVFYDLRHKGNPLAPLVMGLCRVGVYAIAGAWALPRPAPALWLGASLLCAYVLGLTHVARFENERAVVRAWPRIFLYAPLVWTLWRGWDSLFATAISVTLALWIARAIDLVERGKPTHIRAGVVALIAGIALLDAAFLAAAGQDRLAMLALAGFMATLALQKQIAGT